MSDFDGNPCVGQPCNECPWRRDATPGWLGPHSAKEWIRMIHSDMAVACHKTITLSGSWEGASQCAGAAAFRANVAKTPRDPSVAQGPPRPDVFATSAEFVEYHTYGAETWVMHDMYASEAS